MIAERSGVEPHALSGTIRLANGACTTAILRSMAVRLGLEPAQLLTESPLFESGVDTISTARTKNTGQALLRA